MTDLVDDFLEHHGVLGMKWGVRRSSGGGNSSGAVVSKTSGKPAWQRPPSKTVPVAPKLSKSKSGRLVKAKAPKVLSEDAAQFHEVRLKVKRLGVQALTNKDLEIVNKRMELQQKYVKNFPKKKNPLVDLVVDSVLSEWGNTTISNFVGGPHPRSPAKTVQAESVAQAIKAASEVRKLIKPQKTK